MRALSRLALNKNLMFLKLLDSIFYSYITNIEGDEITSMMILPKTRVKRPVSKAILLLQSI